ncbi:TPA: cytochrome c-type biogenesis protein CcmH [Vibrio parahaemolyticus]|uniref:cytochrome c-type biogenesis protein n=1 Tax=Vibrio parahaemolyticus TaxID=670 RepID=UPI00112074E6|nr:cytochrome c-type biogenesis protein [Vibrio parahaemolyticus]EHH1106916.1 cytochrome c-type biogenesis protein CcmH [Vibrio parahaemolyticus]EHK0059463.1 cytochrome c-type biogenesis protein CcmH [Vibrio parahaemolyticus]MBE3857999.1 cytochrome c-type biogenesis protein CcmH [Vibrio parahaemolyticus]TOG21124.1 cytochrome c-type biogenesis protein CcmH [Vibrio parahaemolyticus]HCH0920837.1 cytochrome c-type biogenesis protein CcmH [Vibrio parahaemolyticus]
MRKVILAVFAALTVSLAAHAAIEVYEFDNLEQEQQFKELGHTLRCPKCQNNTISDSNAELAQDLRHKVYEMTKEGKSKEEIVDYMIARYGNFVTYNPPFTMSTAILWLGPLAVVLGGFGLIVLRSRKSKAKVTANNDEKWDEQKEARLKALLEEENNGDNK